MYSKKIPLMICDDVEDYYVRYMWINHKTQNDEFISNYFKPKDEVRLNVRHITKHLSEDWKAHNKIFEDAWHSGDLIWRVKIGNPHSKTIDYIEVWKSKEIFEKLFSVDLDKLSQGIRDSGFEVHKNYGYISEDLSYLYYEKFLNMFKNKKECIVNTPLLGTMGRK